MNCILLAAGYGKRLRPLTLTTPKPAIKIANKPIIRHILDHLEDMGFDDIIVKLHYLPEQVIEAIGKDKYVRTNTERNLTPTAQWLKKIKKYLDEEFLVVNGDTITNLDLSDFCEFHLINKNIATVFTKHDAIHSGGTYAFDKEVLKYIKPEMNIPDLIQALIDKNIPINIYTSDAHYFDCGTLEKLKQAKKFYEKKK